MIDKTITETEDTVSDSMALYYLIREPKIKSDRKKAIILLHGVGSNENDLFSLADKLPRDMYVIAPRGQFALGTGRYAWFNVDFSTGKPVYDKIQELSSRQQITKFIGQVKDKYKAEEVYLGGFSQGGIMSYSIGLTHPKLVKAIFSLSGRLLVEIRPSISKNTDLEGLQVFVAHGLQDNTLSIDYARDAKEYLKSLQVQLNYHEYNMGHQVTESVIKDLNDWLDNQ
ncbi:MAG: alpha/beta fold hydrolase [Bacteroidetes bacterium]|nr:alpha/beta fold hydrolase [Bacteroidota bacterium]